MSSRVLIIGQGIAGTSLAFRCIQKQLLPTVIDRGIESSASFVAVGLVNPISLKRVTPVWKLDNCLISFHEFHEWVKEEIGVNFFVPKPIVKVFHHQSDINNWTEKEDLPLFTPYLRSPENLPQGGEIKGIAGGTVQGGGWVRTKEFLTSSRGYLKEKGMLIEEDFNLSELAIWENAVQYQGLEYDYIVDCTGYNFLLQDYFPEVRIVGNKGEVMTIVPETFSEDAVYSSTYFLLKYRDREYKVGATYSHDLTSIETEESARIELKSGLRRFFTGQYAVKSMEAGIRPTVPDRKPIIGLSTVSTRVAMINGLGSRGYLTAPFLSELLIDLILGSKYLPPEISCLRFL